MNSTKCRSTDVLILGGGPAAITFARTVHQLKSETRMIMLRPEQYSMIYCAIPYALEGLFDSGKVYKKDTLVTEAGVELVHRKAVRVDLEAKCVVDEEGDEYRYETLFVATGADPVRPPIAGIEAANVFTVKSQEDMEGLLQQLDRGPGRTVVVGAGAIGLEQAQAYRERGWEVDLVDSADRVLPNLLDEDMAQPAEEALIEKGIHLHLKRSVASMDVENNRVCRVHLSDGQRLELNPEKDFICFAVGMRPATTLFEGQEIEMTREGIVVDRHMRTSRPDVLAAGDCCAFLSAIDGHPIGGRLATNAVPMGKTAARVYAGLDDEYIGFYNGAATCSYALRVGSTGFTAETAMKRGLEIISGYGSTTTLFPMMPGASDLNVKIVADAATKRILGGQVVSSVPVTDKIDIITLAIQNRLTLRDLSRLSYSSQPWQSYFPAGNAIVQACEQALKAL